MDLGHHDGKRSFETIIERYGLKEKGLLRLAQIVYGADTDDFASDPVAAGLVTIASAAVPNVDWGRMSP